MIQKCMILTNLLEGCDLHSLILMQPHRESMSPDPLYRASVGIFSMRNVHLVKLKHFTLCLSQKTTTDFSQSVN